ncbi:major facilitator superfamily transporter [Fusarium austroafricanum]|uniref:Major facilitator superfamily transporter n=1 Tax=Fusarium austroafricanum TaxID=2364996 RepID=A0A8H4JDF0_9HYPO|nr:major facilitator superfamily transporter [Fusarium austroafricanum]
MLRTTSIQDVSESQLRAATEASASDSVPNGAEANDGETTDMQQGQGSFEIDGTTYPTGLRLALVVLALFASVFIVAISQTILATAIPTITTVFRSYNDIAWYNAGEQITAVALQLPFGRTYSHFNNKWTFLTSVAVFLLGSAVCGSAPTSVALIVGRAIQGVGLAGVFGGSFIIIAHSTPLRKRSLFAGLFGAAYAIASVVGPIIGGVITTRASWRWCFYLNLPIGAIVILVIFFCLPPSVGRTSTEIKKMNWSQIILLFDPLGTALLLTALVCLMLALQWGGGEHPWSSDRVIAVLVVFGATLLPWMALQYFQGDDATVPLSLVKQRSVAAANLYLLFLNGSFGIFIFYLPVWFQTISEDSAESSGLKQLALSISTALSSIIAGGLVVLMGYYNPFVILGSLFVTAGAALLLNIKTDTGLGVLIGAQILHGTGVGIGAEQANVAVQTVLPDVKIARGTTLTLFTRLMGIALFTPIAQNVLKQELTKSLGKSVVASVYDAGGVTDMSENLRKIFGSDTSAYQSALNHVNHALTRTYLLAMILGAISTLFALLVEWKSVKKEKREIEDMKEKKGKE